MSGYSITARDLGGYDYEISNGRASTFTAWHPVEGKFQATELFLGSLGACMLATMMYTASVMGLDLGGAWIQVDADSETKPDRMVNIRVVYHLPAGLSDSQKASLIRAGNRCKVHSTIEDHPQFDCSIVDL